jgi:N-acetylmuramoyl-L-alanine amidase
MVLLSCSSSTIAEEGSEDMKYMSEAIYFEARDQAIVGQVAVGCTILNRVNKKNWPNSVREVVHQHKQFSYYSDGKPEVYNDKKSHYIAWEVSDKVLNSNICDMFDGVDHYLNKELSPAKWYESMSFIMTIGDHTFYRRDKS